MCIDKVLGSFTHFASICWVRFVGVVGELWECNGDWLAINIAIRTLQPRGDQDWNSKGRE